MYSTSAFILFFAVVATLQAKDLPQNDEDDFFNIGEFGGKQFFVNVASLRWAAAAELCTANNMVIATITDPVEAEYLDGAFVELNNTNSRYWIAGRREVVWTIIGEPFDTSVMGPVDYSAEAECFAIRYPRAEYWSQWRTLPCNDQWPVLCQN